MWGQGDCEVKEKQMLTNKPQIRRDNEKGFKGENTKRNKEIREKIHRPPSPVLTMDSPFPLPGFSKSHAQHLAVLLLLFLKSLLTFFFLIFFFGCVGFLLLCVSFL